MAHPRELIRRLGIAGILVALVFVVRLAYQASAPEHSYWLQFTGAYLAFLVFAGYQVLRAAALIAASRKMSSPLIEAVHLRGIRGTLLEIFRRRLSPGLRLPLIFALWASAIIGTVLLLWSTRSLEGLQARFFGALGAEPDSSGVPICKIVALETPDNNPRRYYRALTALVRSLSQAGAKIILAERSMDRHPNSPWNTLLDSLTQPGVILFESGRGIAQSLPLPNPPSVDWSRASLLNQSRPIPEEGPVMIGFRPVPSWYNLQLHCALQTLAILRGEMGRLQPSYRDGEIRYGDLRIPVTEKGEAYAPVDRRVWKGMVGFAYLREGCDTLYYVEGYGPVCTQAMSPAFAARVRGEIVAVDWIETGGLNTPPRNRNLYALTSVIEALQRGRLLSPAPLWHHLITILAILMGIGLSLGKHLRVAFPAMVLLAAAILAADLWLYSSQSVLADLIYPAVAAVLSGILFPLATYFHRHP